MSSFDATITFCFTPDLAATAAFYEGVLELPLALDQGSCRIYRTSVDGYLGFCERATTPRPETVILTLVTEDVDGWCARLVERGVALEQAPRHHPDYGIHHAFLRDPNGYLLEIQRFDDPAWDSSTLP